MIVFVNLGLGSWLGSALGGLFGAGASIYGASQSVKAQEKANEANFQINAMNNQANRDLAEYAYSENLAQWERENAYNSPEAMLGRLRDAGLNPNLIYNNSSAGVVSASSPEYKAPEMRAVQVQAAKLNLEGFSQSIQNMAANTAFLAAKTEKIKSDIRKNDASTDKIVNETEFLSKSMQDRLELVKQSLSQAINNTQISEARSILINNDKERDNAKLEAELSWWSNDLTNRYLDIIKSEDRQRDLGIEINEQKLEVLKKSIELANKDMILKDDVHAMNQFEIGLNKIGLTRSDDVYWRLLYQFGSWWLNNAGTFGDMFTSSGTNANGSPRYSPTAPLP